MKPVWVIADAIVSPFGDTTEENFRQVADGISGLKKLSDQTLSKTEVVAGKISSFRNSDIATRFEYMCLKAINGITVKHNLPKEKTLFILSTTKGNIAQIDQHHPRLSLHAVADFLAKSAGVIHSTVVSNACISGVMAMTVASRFLQTGKFEHALIVGADELTQFVISGFQSLQALSDDVCKPFDASRKGINLGEAAAAILLSVNPSAFSVKPQVQILGSGLTNDANHISGPSRTGEELALAIRRALKESKVGNQEIDFVSAHGTATLYNDEMEAKAFHLAGLGEKPVNSLKPFYGHTLGAAGVVETIISIHGLKHNTLIPTLGYQTSGVSKSLHVIARKENKSLSTFLKTASGFGGCNAAIVVQKVNG